MFKRDQIRVTSHLEKLSVVQQWFELFMSGLAVDHPWLNEQFDQLNLALAEGFTNAVRHAHANLPDTTPIDIELSLESEQLESEKIEICIFDCGGPFDPSSLREPQPGALCEGGYGWFLLRRLADKVTYDRAEANFPEDMPEDTPSAPLNNDSLTEKISTGPSEEALAEPLEETATTSENRGPSAQRQRNCLRIVKTSKIV